MGDINFFGFESSLPDVRKEKNIGSQRIFGEGGEDDIDLLNDQTFGDYDACDWEASHKRLAEGHEDSFFNRTEDSGYKTRKFEDDETQEEDLEQQLSHLVSDEDDDSELADPRGRAIPGRHVQDLDELFGPASPPGLLDAEQLVSPNSKNIWRPPGQSPSNGLLALIKGSEHHNSAFEDPAIVSAVRASNLPKAPTLMGNIIIPTTPKVITVEELERNLHTSSAGSFPPRSFMSPTMRMPPTSVISQPVGSTPFNTPQGPMILQRLPQMTPSTTFDGRRSPLQMVLQGRMTPPNLPTHIRTSPTISEISSPGTGFRRTPSPPTHSNNNMPILVPHSVAAKLYPHLIGTPFAKPMAGGIAIDPRAINRTSSPPINSKDGWQPPSPGYPFLSNSPIGPRIPPRMSNTDPIHVRHRQQYNYRDQHSHDTPYNGYRHNRPFYTPGPRGGGYNVRQQLHYRWDDDHTKPVDEYDNLMTQREKDWIVKIQLLQLQTDNPYLDDYYYTTLAMKKMALDRQKKKDLGIIEEDADKEPKLLLPQVAKIERVYTPAQFEGVLGKLTTSSVHNPRTIIDAKVNVHTSDDKDKPKDNRKYRQLLYNIEKVYDMLLDVDDLEKKVLTLPEDQRQPFYAERKFKIRKMVEILTCDNSNPELFLQCMCIRKGKKLVHRLLPLCDKEHGVRVACTIIRNLPTIIRKDVQDESLPSIYSSTAQVISAATMAELILFAEELQKANVTPAQHNSVLTALQNKYGVTVILELLNRAESIYSYDPIEIDSKSHDQWSVFVTSIGENLRSLSVENICQPLKKFNSLERHLDRMLDNKIIVSIEDKLKKFSGP